MRRVLPLILGWLILLSSVVQGYGFDPKAYPLKVAGAHFVVYYDINGPNATTPALANQVLAEAERAYRKLVTEGGLRPPRVEPVPVQLRATNDVEGGSVMTVDHGFDLSVAINPQMTGEFALGDVVAHEVFHVLQTSYGKARHQPQWAIEGTAPLASLYTYSPDSPEFQRALRGYVSQYYAAQGLSMKDEPYLSSLFWYWVAEQYGGVTYLGRLLRWSEDVEWERAAQLAAIEGGAPADITFDKLWRGFIFALVDGRMPKPYKTDTWFRPAQLTWAGTATGLTHGAQRTGIGPLGHHYIYYEPLSLGPYAFDLIEVQAQSTDGMELTVVGDPQTLEAYVIQPGVRMMDALGDYAKRPSPNNLVAPPADLQTRGVQVAVGSPVRLPYTGSRVLILLMRLGNYGHSTYGVRLAPPDRAAGLSGTWQELRQIPQPADSIASPLPLTADEAAALKAGTYLSHLGPLQAEQLKVIPFQRITLKVGSDEIPNGATPLKLPVPVQRDKEGRVWFPVKAVAEALGGRVEGRRYFFGDSWVEVSLGGAMVLWDGVRGPSDVVREANGVLLATLDFFGWAGVGISYYGDTYEFTLPNARRLVE